MTPDDIQHALSTADDLPKEALRAGMTVAAEIAPSVIVAIDKAASGDTLSAAEAQLLYYGLHVLAAARDPSACRPFMRLLERSEGDLVEILGDEYIPTAARLLLGLFDGDASLLTSALAKRTMDGGARWSLFKALARLTWEGRVPAAHAEDVIDRFAREGLAEDGDLAWIGWQDAIMYLGLADRAPLVRAALTSGRIAWRNEADQREWSTLLAFAVEAPRDETRFIGDRLVPIEDPVAALSWGEELGYAPPEIAAAPDGRGFSMKPDQPLRLARDKLRKLPSRSTKVGRNEPCPCGSGKKYKRCCGGARTALH
ncbi:MAG: SEC-C metal-binding domain-containing protein [Alphaproteobacteria bacterium]|nr:SEC-C metal-binding domain-containing protein [Alphaproteobacteria bacterium]